MTLVLPRCGFEAFTAISFNPANISGLIMWFDASNTGSITKDGSNNVSQWNDLSGSGNYGSASRSARPVLQAAAQNGLNTIRFTSANSQYLALNAAVNCNMALTFVGVMARANSTDPMLGPTNTSSPAPYPLLLHTDQNV